MKRLVLLLICGMVQCGYSQKRLNFKSLRYDEQYGKMANDTNETFLDRIKFIALDASVNMSLGGELRSQYQYFKNENWGDIEDDTDGFLLNRVLFHVDTKYKKSVRFFAQLQSSTTISRIDPSPIEKNELDFHQLFMDLNFKLSANDLTFRIGRQEFLYGSQRLVAVREGPNSRQSFDAIKLIWKYKTIYTDVFYSQYVRNKFGIFNDFPDSDTKFYGLYSVIKKIPVLENIDLYYLGLNRKDASFNNISGNENRHSVGTRVWSTNKIWNYDFEAVYQFGTMEDESIEAWTVSLYTNYQFHTLKFKPRLGFKTELISGDKSNSDKKLQTFNPLFPKGAYFGLAALLGPSNLYDIHPSIELELNDKLSFSIDYDVFWRFSKNDGIYQPSTTLLYPSADSPHRFIGSQLGVALDYDIKKWISLKLESTWFDTGSYLKDVSTGKDIFFIAATLCLRF